MEAKFYNMTVKQEGDEIVVRIKATAEGRPSSTGKTTTIATTGKPKEFQLDDGSSVMLGINCFKYPER